MKVIGISGFLGPLDESTSGDTVLVLEVSGDFRVVEVSDDRWNESSMGILVEIPGTASSFTGAGLIKNWLTLHSRRVKLRRDVIDVRISSPSFDHVYSEVWVINLIRSRVRSSDGNSQSQVLSFLGSLLEEWDDHFRFTVDNLNIEDNTSVLCCDQR